MCVFRSSVSLQLALGCLLPDGCHEGVDEGAERVTVEARSEAAFGVVVRAFPLSLPGGGGGVGGGGVLSGGGGAREGERART